MKTSHAAFAIALTTATFGSLAIAGSASNSNSVSAAQTKQWLEIPVIYEKMAAAGYTAIHEIERERKDYGVKATSTDGKRVELLVDPITGAVLKSSSK